MYHQYFGLTEPPFSIAVNPRYLFMSARHRDALAHLLYGVGAGGGFILLTGEVGTGKTTINRCLLEQLPEDTDVAIILNPALNAPELLATVCDELGVEYGAEKHTLKSLTDSLHRFLLDNHAKGRKTVLMIDEAQHLDFVVLEQIRLLTNLETNSEKLLQIILVGQPELAEMLARPELRQLNQRITARYNLEPLNLAETRAYIQHRLQVAGMAPDRVIFPARIIRGIFRHTRGIPRLINVVCDRVLLGAYGRNKTRADQSTLRLAVDEVLGEARARHAARWPWALLALLCIGAAVAWWARNLEQPLDIAVLASPAQQSSGVVDVNGIPAAPETSLAPTSSAMTTGTVPAIDQARDDGADVAVADAKPWLMSPAAAADQLWSLSSDLPPPEEPCGDSDTGIACIQGQALTWDELASLQRPVLLQMITPERFAAAAVLIAIEERSAWLAVAGRARKIPLTELASIWSGGYVYLWQVPRGFERPLALGDSDPAVAEVAALFARLDDQTAPLAGRAFTPALKQRVMLFQRAQGLEDDGVVGRQTLLKLNETLGIDTSSQRALAMLQTPAREP